MNDLHIDGTSVRSDRHDLIVDLGAVGKGFAVDRAIAILKAHGIANALVDAGGNLRAIGASIDAGRRRPWRVAIRDPRAVGALAWLELGPDESVSTSGDYERYFIENGKRMPHLLDPRTGAPASHTIAVTVVAADATLADAASTALFVAGPDRWQRIARALRISQVLRVDADGHIEVTQTLDRRLRKPGGDTRPITWTVVDL